VSGGGLVVATHEGLDDAHAAIAAWAGMLTRFWLFRLGVGGLDGIDWNEWNREQRADACNILGAGLAGEETAVADAVGARWQDVHAAPTRSREDPADRQG
jgi:hypothetical protein